ncbi:S8 family serine peptidase [Vulgatibacter sp.]|uniref:S8 family serine peptidase n=1 Tax=Vulgatibacter sp. TaxID=1971226 RepID=UPI003568D857
MNLLLASLLLAGTAAVPRTAGDAPLSPDLLVHGGGSGELPAPTQPIFFRDGDRDVLATRGAFDPPTGRSAVQLRWPALDASASATVGPEALVRGTEAELRKLGLVPVRLLFPSLDLWMVRKAGADGLEIAAALAGTGVAAYPDLAFPLRQWGAQPPDDPRFSGQWYFERIGITDAWEITTGSPEVTVVVVDNGCDPAHPDLAGKYEPGRDVVDDDDDPSHVPGASGNEHGTACAGIIGAAADNGIGIAGACPQCRVSCVRMLRHDGLPQPVSVSVAAFAFAHEIGAAVVSNSWGYVEAIPAPALLADAIREVHANARGGRGAVVAFAAGNDGRTVEAWELLGVEGVLGVGAINTYDESTAFTNGGAPVDLVAPAGTLTTDVSGADGGDAGDYTSLFGGTSSACPVVAGVAGLLASAAPDATATEIDEALLATLRPAPYAAPDETGHDAIYGYGIVDPTAALRRFVPEPGGGGGAGAPPSQDDTGCAAGGSDLTGLGLLAVAALLSRHGRRPPAPPCRVHTR